MEPDLPDDEGRDAPDPDPDRPTPRADNDQQLAADLTRWERVLTAARDDAEAQTHLAAVGYAPAKLDELLALVAAAQSSYEARTTADVARGKAVRAQQVALAAAVEAHTAFRKVARARLGDDPDALAALELTDEPPRALDPFVTHARASYAGAATLDAEPAAALAEVGYGPDRMAALTAGVQAVVDAERAQTAAETAAKGATKTRDADARDARRAFGTFRDIGRTVLPQALRDRIGLG